MADTRVKRQNPTVNMEMVEIYNELIKDLLQVPGSQTSYLELGEHAEKGTFIKVCIAIKIWTPEIILVLIMKFELCSFTII